MIDFGEPGDRPRGESIVPMINVVFLLLVFFLMTATIAPPDPFDIAPPEVAAGAPAEAAATLYLAADGRLAFGTARGAAVFAAIATAPDVASGGLTLRADGSVPGAAVARLLERLAAIGVARVDIVTVGR